MAIRIGSKELITSYESKADILAMGALLTEQLPGNCEDNNIHKDHGLVFRGKVKYYK